MKDSEVILEEFGIDITNDPEGIDKLVELIGEDNAELAGSSEDISIITEDED